MNTLSPRPGPQTTRTNSQATILLSNNKQIVRQITLFLDPGWVVPSVTLYY